MLEYASVTASAYDVDSLVGKLNAHASQGWEVTSVVAAGGDVVAIMQRVRSAVDSAPAEAVAAEEAPVVAAVATEHVAVEAEPVIEEAPAFSEAASSVAEVAAPAVEASPLIESVAEAAPAGVAEAASSVADHASDAFGAGDALGGAGAGIAGAAAGVGLGSIFGNDAPADVAVPEVEAVIPTVEAVAPVIETIAPAVAEVPAAVEPTGWGSAQTTVGTPVVPTPAPAPAPVVTTPAGWYPDPSGRFEMRYWDGSAWTEHVSRQGQQFTDPPVA
jgi:Protein of unknown function (DUF2510)